MTDTTYIKALSNERLLEIKSILSGFEDGYDTVDDKENYEAMRGAQLLIDELISLRDQLEAERQRADDEKALNKHLDLAIRQSEGVNANLRRLAEKAEAELASLKGDQVPFAYAYHRDTGVWWLSLEKPKLPGYTEVRELFTAPQKPVVLPGIGGVEPTSAPEFVNYADGWRDGINECRKAIEAAGGIVKDGE